MDFVARAGAFIDRAHRVAGFLLICCVLLGVTSFCQWQQNVQLNRINATLTQRLPVIVVPGAVPGKYNPQEDGLLVNAFVDYITQSFNTFTPANVGAQLDSVSPFMGPDLLVDSRPAFERKVRDAEALKRASLFIPDRSTLQIKRYTKNSSELRDVTLQGELRNFAAGTLAEVIPVQMNLTLQKTVINPDVNRFGFMLMSYKETPLIDRNNQPKLPPIDTSGPVEGSIE
jgi:hypothetical protein